MEYPHDNNRGAGDLEDDPIVPKQQMTIGGAKEFAFRYEGATLRKHFQCSDLFFQTQNKGRGRFRIIRGDVIPYFGRIRLGRCGQINAEFFWHV